MVDVNLTGAFQITQAAANRMKAQGIGGAIGATSSISALVGGGMQTHYTPTKAGVHSLMQTVAVALGPHGIRCNSVMPGAIGTDLKRADWSDPEKRAYLEGRIPLGRFGEPRAARRGRGRGVPRLGHGRLRDRRVASGRWRALREPAIEPLAQLAAGPLHHQRGTNMSSRHEITDVRTYLVGGEGSGGDYHRQSKGHWLVDTLIANPISGYADYKASRTSWGIGVLGSILVEIETGDGTVGVATGFGGPPAVWLIQEHFRRFLVGADVRNVNRLWDQMYRASMFYGRKGMPVAAISAVDLALWDTLGRLRDEPVYNLIGGLSRDEIAFYCTGPAPGAVKEMGFWGAKVPLPHGPGDGEDGLRANVAYLTEMRDLVGPDFPLMVDCYMSLTVPYAIRLAEKCRPLDIYWWEEVLTPDDVEGFRHLKQAHPTLKWTTGEHEYTRYGFRRLIEERNIDILQPDVMWVGGLTELLRISAQAAAYDIPVIPHGSGPYSYHFIASQPHSPFCEYIAASPDGRSVQSCFGGLFSGEEIPRNGRLKLNDRPGFGMDVADRSALRAYHPGDM